MSAHNFWNNFTHGFMHGMFNSNPFFGCFGGNWGCNMFFNSCFAPFPPIQFNSFNSNLYFVPNVFSAMNFNQLMPNMSPPMPNTGMIDMNKLFPVDNWQAPSDNNYNFQTNIPTFDTFERTITAKNKKTTKPDSTPNQKLTDKYKGSAEQLNKQLNRKNGVLSNKGDVFLAAQEKYGVNAAILAAICIHETGYGTSSLAKNKNNVGGVSAGNGFKSYSSVDECIMDMARFLKNSYIDKGIVTIADVGKKYCPVGDPRDTKGTNGGWGNAVSGITKRIETLA